MTESINFQTIKNVYDCYARGDADSFYKDISPDLTWIECEGFPQPGVFHTRAEIDEKVFGALARDWDDWMFELETIADAGDFVVALGSYRGTHRGTRKSFRARAAHVWHLRIGKIIRFEQFADTAVMLKCAPSGVDAATASS